MNPASQCETLFNDVQDLGDGVAAIGSLLRAGQNDACPDVLNGIGAVLYHLGKSMAGLNQQFMAGTYQGIRALEVKEEQAATAIKQAIEQEEREKLAQENIERLKSTEWGARLYALLDEDRITKAAGIMMQPE